MLTSFQIVKVGHASRLKKSSGFNSARAVHEHRLKGSQKFTKSKHAQTEPDGRIVKLLG